MNRDSKGGAPSQDSLKKQAEKELASGNPSQLGDPTSLKAETSKMDPTKDEAGTKKDGQKGHETLSDLAKKNPTMLGDPVSLKAESADSEPTENDRGAAGTGKSKL